MTTLANNFTTRDYEQGDRNEFPVVASDIIYNQAAVGLVIASGHARPLTSVDKFVGFAEKFADNSSGSAADITVRTYRKGRVKLPVSGAVITDVGLPVYAQDDNAFSFIKTSGVFIGFAVRFIASGYMMVAFDIDNYKDPYDGLLAETLSANKTLDAQDQGKVFFVDTDAFTITLPAVAGMKFKIVNAGAYGTIAVTISPDAADGIGGPNLTAVDDKDLINTKATANRGDSADIVNGDATGWISALTGTWVKE